MATVKEATDRFIQAFCNEGKMFWRETPPVDYTTGIQFEGINALILGTSPFNRGENRWLTDAELHEAGLSVQQGTQPENIVLYVNGTPDVNKGTVEWGDRAALVGINAWSAFFVEHATSGRYSSLARERTQAADLSAVLPLGQIPFRDENGVRYFNLSRYDRFGYDGIHHGGKLDMKPVKFFRNLAMSYIARILHSDGDMPVPGSQDAVFDALTAELAASRLCHTLNCKIDSADRETAVLRDQLNALPLNDENRMGIVRAFADAAYIETQLLSNEPPENAYDLDNYEEIAFLKPIIGEQEWYMICAEERRTAAYTLMIENLKANVKNLKEAKDGTIARLRYLSDLSDEESSEFYATSYDPAANEISGVLSLDGNGEGFRMSFDPEVLHSSFSVDLTWTPCKVSDIDKSA